MKINQLTNESFKNYGRIISGCDITELLEVMKSTPVPEGVVYEPSVVELESLNVKNDIESKAFGQLPIQIGYCNGNNYMLNAVEYHRTSEINIAVTDLIVLVGMQQDIQADYTYETQKVEAFLVPAGIVVEFYATTLHFAPCNANENGFRCAVVLPKGTNTPLREDVNPVGEDALLFANNKWLIGHEDATDLVDGGAFIGLVGENLSVKN